jgi:Tol biopolymer transport system component
MTEDSCEFWDNLDGTGLDNLDDKIRPMKLSCRPHAAPTIVLLLAVLCISRPLKCAAADTALPFRIAFVRRNIKITSTLDERDWIFTMDSSGKNLRDLKLEGSDPSWSPDGRQLAFASSRDERGTELYISNDNGSGIVRLTRTKGGSGVEKPAWSPDGKEIAFVKWSENIPDIYAITLASNQTRRITSGGGIYPTWSADGKKLAFASARNGAIQIYSCNPDGTDIAQLTNVDPGASQPAWSPDGNKILYTTSHSDSAASVGILDIPSHKASRFAYSDKFSFFSPAWSPDGRTVLLEMSGTGGFFLSISNPYASPNLKAIGWKHQILALGIDGSSRQLTKADDGGGAPSAGRIP